MKKGLITISTPKWKVREYVRLFIGGIMVIAVLAFFVYLTFYAEYQRINFINWLFG